MMSNPVTPLPEEPTPSLSERLVSPNGFDGSGPVPEKVIAAAECLEDRTSETVQRAAGAAGAARAARAAEPPDPTPSPTPSERNENRNHVTPLPEEPTSDGHPYGCIYPNGMCTCPVVEHNHPPFQAVTGCAACVDAGEVAILKLADRIRAQRYPVDGALLREGYEAHKDWTWGDA